ncbi:MAG: site-specific integrase, partial [Candidatus Electrothrix sp. AUS1_2]|nr:site-specific integrase [Candidatus Electrothrix sp. AUS1_2]
FGVFGIHSIRHLSASILIRNKVSLIDVQTVLRHKNMTTTQRYVHRLESVRSALDVFV